jgi:hypothetical protein
MLVIELHAAANRISRITQKTISACTTMADKKMCRLHLCLYTCCAAGHEHVLSITDIIFLPSGVCAEYRVAGGACTRKGANRWSSCTDKCSVRKSSRLSGPCQYTRKRPWRLRSRTQLIFYFHAFCPLRLHCSNSYGTFIFREV